MKNKFKILFLVALLFSIGNQCLAAEEGKFDYKLLESVPLVGKAGEVVKFPEYISGVYKFVFVAITISALLMLTIGGFYYLASAGNQSTAGTAKKIITDAILGLIVAFVSWVILNTIDPAILSGKLDTSVLRVVEDSNVSCADGDPDIEKYMDTYCSCKNGAKVNKSSCLKDVNNAIGSWSWECILPDGSSRSCKVTKPL